MVTKFLDLIVLGYPQILALGAGVAALAGFWLTILKIRDARRRIRRQDFDHNEHERRIYPATNEEVMRYGRDRFYKERVDAHNREVRERDRRRAEESRRASSGGQASCFAAGTKIRTLDGPRCIESLKVGDHVSAFCEATGECVQRPVRRHDAHSAARIWLVTIAGATGPIATTGAHLFLTGSGWRRARQLRSGDILRTSKGWQSVKAVQVTERAAQVYNLVIEDALTFFADGVVVHSFAHFRTLRTWLHRIGLGFRRVGGKKSSTSTRSPAVATARG
jgi:Pretoxin HINT domain